MLALSSLFVLDTNAANPTSNDCSAGLKAIPAKIGDMDRVNVDCTFVDAAMAKSMGVPPGARYINARFEKKGTERYIDLKFNDGQSGMPTAATEAPIIESEKEAHATLKQAAATGAETFVKASKDLDAHSRSIALAKPDQAVLVIHDDPDGDTEVTGVVNDATFVTMQLSDTTMGGALATMNQINAAVNYAALQR
jgi:hypothetical protein